MTSWETQPQAEPQQQQRDKYPFWTYQDLVVFIGLGLPLLVISALLVKLLTVIAPGTFSSAAAPLLAAQFLGYGLWFFCLYGLLRLRYGRPFWRSLAWVRPKGGWTMWGTAGPFVALGVVALGALLRTPEIQMPMKDLLSDRFSIILVGVFAVTLGPVCEELAFRGFLLPLLVRSFGPAAGIVLTALPFALLHGPQYAWSWRHLLLITLAGTAFGWVRYRTGSTEAATMMHSTYNLTFFVAYLLQWKDLPTRW
jgi:membrane protease YdiL (CAAX protease family)